MAHSTVKLSAHTLTRDSDGAVVLLWEVTAVDGRPLNAGVAVPAEDDGVSAWR